MLTRFVPIIRTFVPFVAGAGAMRYPTFALYNVGRRAAVGGRCAWAPATRSATCPVIKNNFSLVALGIVAVSLLPVLVEWLKQRKPGQRTLAAQKKGSGVSRCPRMR